MAKSVEEISNIMDELLSKQSELIVRATKTQPSFNDSKPCYCSLCERYYKNYKRFCIHMKKIHYPNI